MPSEPTESDLATANLLLQGLPPALRLAVAAHARPLILAAMENERERLLALMRSCAKYHEREQARTETQIQAAVITGAPVAELAQARVMHGIACGAIMKVHEVAGRAPGSCARCGGAKVLPTNIVLPGGQRPLVACPACSAPPANGAATEPAAP